MTDNKANGSSKDEPDFDTESPDAEDPQMDPTEPAKPQANEEGTKDDYPPYNSEK
ncbi:hypothetical protein KDX38_04540 [Pseudomonas sp. CDFA 602]|uniref:DUF6021 family protein n=1 Tax=Pseudomonas californiensis TaxID=2829823 RepID=UPI001E582950|nr:DUF6021 family protein [Pseudomonas californiensis]MCD5993106.1 hypothetical protein [Pseudomonas californiensis]MCD5998483.1 hypothetical protein [Pseudomonas californiensis]